MARLAPAPAGFAPDRESAPAPTQCWGCWYSGPDRLAYPDATRNRPARQKGRAGLQERGGVCKKTEATDDGRAERDGNRRRRMRRRSGRKGRQVVDEVSFVLVFYWPIAVHALNAVWAPDARDVLRGTVAMRRLSDSQVNGRRRSAETAGYVQQAALPAKSATRFLEQPAYCCRRDGA